MSVLYINVVPMLLVLNLGINYLSKISIFLICIRLRIDTSGWGVNFDALFDKVWRSCSLRDYYILYIFR